GVLATPELAAITTVPSSPFLTCLPAGGVCPTIAPGLAPGLLTCSGGFAASFSPALLRSFSASNTLAALLRSGTVVCFGSSSASISARTITIGATIASHHGNQGRCL